MEEMDGCVGQLVVYIILGDDEVDMKKGGRLLKRRGCLSVSIDSRMFERRISLEFRSLLVPRRSPRSKIINESAGSYNQL